MPKEEEDVKPFKNFPPISRTWARSLVFQVPGNTTQASYHVPNLNQNPNPNQNDQGIVNHKVKGQDGTEVIFRMKRSMSMWSLMTAYSDHRAVAYNTFVFLFDGRRLRPDHTPAQLNMEDGDEIDAMLHQIGGMLV